MSKKCKSFPLYCTSQVHVEELCNLRMESYFLKVIQGSTLYVCPQCEAAYKCNWNEFKIAHKEHLVQFTPFATKNNIVSQSKIFKL